MYMRLSFYSNEILLYELYIKNLTEDYPRHIHIVTLFFGQHIESNL